jgi:anti-sigma B factor antagonist
VPNIDFDTSRDASVAVIALRGELDLFGATVLEAEVDRLIGDPGVGTLVLDLRALEFLDSSGLRMVVVTDKRARAAGRRLALVRGGDTVHRVFEITRMSDRLDFVADPAEARAGAERR